MSVRVRHRLVLRDPHRGAVLLLRREDGWRLPELDLEERHTAEVEHVNAAVRERWGLATAVLRGLEHVETPGATRRAHALELLGEAAALSASAGETAAWISEESLERLDLERGEQLLVWQALADAETEGTADCPWTRPGWWPEVRGWIEARIGPADIVQTRAWESSCVARARAGGADYYFKAVPASARREVRVTAHLARERGSALDGGAPDVVAADLERAWMLMRAFGGRSLDEVREPAAWERAAATYARLQVETLGRRGELLALGCSERGLTALVAAVEPLLADTAALLPGDPEGLTADQIEALRRAVPALRRDCDALAELGLADALDHGDLWPSNLLDDGSACVIIDWEDAGIHHPFLSLGPFVVMLREWRIGMSLARLAEVYLPPFAGAAPIADLRRAFALALPLALVEMAVRYWRVPAAVADLHPWMRQMVPFFLRHALELRAAT